MIFFFLPNTLLCGYVHRFGVQAAQRSHPSMDTVRTSAVGCNNKLCPIACCQTFCWSSISMGKSFEKRPSQMVLLRKLWDDK